MARVPWLLRDDRSISPFWYALKLYFPSAGHFYKSAALNGLRNRSQTAPKRDQLDRMGFLQVTRWQGAALAGIAHPFSAILHNETFHYFQALSVPFLLLRNSVLLPVACGTKCMSGHWKY